jgi:BirA family transcriptional regulator, biotin operon repressor / biotin---[acetyl-CoA-carboxylase] ligase
VYKILANSPFLTNHVHYLPSCHSTNEIAHDLLSSSPAEGTVVICDDQFAGKGQGSNQWKSKKGKNLTLSLILRPAFLKPNEQFLITVVLSLAIKDMLEEILPGEVQIKWPNDIFFNNRKISGLLIENVLRGNKFDSCIVGIGLNVNQLEFEEELNATSIALISKQQYYLNSMLNKLMTSIASFYQELQAGKTELLRQRYFQCLLGIGEEREFITDGKKFTGVIEGTDEFGRLLIRKGIEVLVFQHKEVQMLF